MEGYMTQCSVSRKETTQQRILTYKSAISTGAWNVRTIFDTARAREMRNYKLQLLGLSETRWNQYAQTRLSTCELILYSGHTEEQAHHTEGVTLMLNQQAQKVLIGWEPVCSRIITAK